MSTFDTVIVGGGIVGLATAMELLSRFPKLRLSVLEKEDEIASHQTSHNSGVIHSGIYYKPGSVKAKTCVAGAKLMVEFCKARNIAYEVCGKVVVATSDSEVSALDRLYQQGLSNNVPGVSLIGPDRLREIEPHVRGMRALHVPGAAIVDFAAVARAMAEVIKGRGGEIQTSTQVKRFSWHESLWTLETTAREIRSMFLITCGGLYADQIAVMAGATQDLLITPFRGEYYELVPEKRFLVRGMVYPVPDPSVPFLGLHLTRTISGSVEAGPNAVLAFKREGYRKTDISPREAFDMFSRRAFWRMARKYWAVGLSESYRSWSKAAFARQLRCLIPALTSKDLSPGKTGVRAQAVDSQGCLLDDFNIVCGKQAIHVRNVPSPAATASLRVAQIIADQAGSMMAT